MHVVQPRLKKMPRSGNKICKDVDVRYYLGVDVRYQ